MPTDIPTFRARLLDERAAVAAEIAAIDVVDERARYDAAEAIFRTAQNNFSRVTQRWTLVNEKLERLQVLDAQIDLVTP